MKSTQKTTNHKIIIISLVFLLLIIIMITIFVKSLKEDTKQNEKVITQLKKDYQTLESQINDYNNGRTSLAEYLENSYTEELPNYYEDIIQLLQKIETNLKTDEKTIQKIEKNCQGKVFVDTKVNSICNSYQEYYEQLVNIYINDTKKVNELITSYNQESTSPLAEYSSTPKDYIDYNKDGIYSERDEK